MTVNWFADISTQDPRMQAHPGVRYSFQTLAEMESALLADAGAIYPVDCQVSYRLLQICVYEPV
jgi:hypothetical protein